MDQARHNLSSHSFNEAFTRCADSCRITEILSSNTKTERGITHRSSIQCNVYVVVSSLTLIVRINSIMVITNLPGNETQRVAFTLLNGHNIYSLSVVVRSHDLRLKMALSAVSKHRERVSFSSRNIIVELRKLQLSSLTSSSGNE